MRVLLIHPHDTGVELAMLTYRNPMPMALPLVASLMPPDTKVAIQDENLSPVDLDWEGDLVALTVAVHKAPRAATLARHFRERGIPVLMGGAYPTLAPEAARAEANAVVVGPVEAVWPRVLADLQAGRLAGIYEGDGTRAVIAAADSRYMAMDETRCYVEASRGCDCGDPWCAVGWLQGERVQRRPPQAIADETIASLADRPHLNLRFLLGEGLLDDAGWATALCAALAPLNIWWSASAGIKTQPEILARAFQSGCFLVLLDVGDHLHDYPKETHGLGEFINRCHQVGLGVMVRFQFGYPSDGPDCFDRVLAFCEEHEVELADLALRTPPYGSSVYQVAEATNNLIRTTPEWFDGRHATVKHTAMPAEEWEAGLAQAWMNVYSKGSIRRRLKRHLTGGFPVAPETPRPYERRELVPLMNLALKVAVVKT